MVQKMLHASMRMTRGKRTCIFFYLFEECFGMSIVYNALRIVHKIRGKVMKYPQVVIMYMNVYMFI
jgi:hypothetical protein